MNSRVLNRALTLGIVVFVFVPSAFADEPLYDERHDYLEVADAAGEDDPFDMNVHIAFRHLREHASFGRETTSGTTQFADFTRLSTILDFTLDVGIYRDLMFFARVPIMLSDEVTLNSSGPANRALLSPTERGLEPLVLLGSQLDSAPRSGLDSIWLGLAWAPINTPLNWVLRVSGRFSVGKRRNPCVLNDSMGCDPGISDGTHSLRIESRFGQRFRFAEVYLGGAFDFAFVGRGKSRLAPNDFAGYGLTRPPMRVLFDVGAAFVPWEDRRNARRISVDTRLSFEWISRGRDYSGLYDALGTSLHPALVLPNPEALPESMFGAETFNGVTTVASYARFGGTLGIHVLAARYIKLMASAGAFYRSAHDVTGTQACNGASADEEDPRAQPCASGLANPQFRPAIDAPGQRFRHLGGVDIELAVGVSVRF